MSDALKSCPFCGASGEELMKFCDPREGSDNSGPSRRIQCAGCNIEAPFYDTEAEAVAAWNTRAESWRDLALQFDGHRIEALSLLRYVSEATNQFETLSRVGEIKAFLAKPPLSGEAVLAQRIAALSTPDVQIKEA